MDPSCVACPHLACPDKGTVGGGNIRVHARAERRYRCRTGRRTFAATTNTPLYRLHHPEATLTLVLTLLLHGCPVAAVVAAFGLDERTVRAWLHKGGAHAALLHDLSDRPVAPPPHSPRGSPSLWSARRSSTQGPYVLPWEPLPSACPAGRHRLSLPSRSHYTHSRYTR